MSFGPAWAETVSYIDAEGKTKSADATPLTGSETTLLGGWYVVNSSITYDHTLTLSGDVGIILADDCTMNIGMSTSRVNGRGIDNDPDNGMDTLRVFGQSTGTGTLSVYTTDYSIAAATVFIYGGTVIADSSTGNALGGALGVQVHGGSVTATAGSKGIVTGFGRFDFYGGKVSASGESYGLESPTVNLSYKNVDDSITISSFYPYNELAITVEDGKTFTDTDGTNDYSGNLTASDIAGKTLKPKTYPITYSLDDGTATGNPASYATGISAITLKNPVKPGQKFLGWTGTGLDSATKTVTIPKDATGDREYTATWGEYPNTYSVSTPAGLNITRIGWNSEAGVITADAVSGDFDPDKKIVITVTSPNGWKLKDTSFWGWLNSDTVSYTLKAKSTDTSETTSWTFTSADLFKSGGTTVTFGADVEDFSGKRPGSYEDPVVFRVSIE